MNIKIKSFSLVVAILFLNVLFVLIDKKENVAKAGPCSDCTTYCQQYGKSKAACKADDCLRACTPIMPNGGAIIYDQEMCLDFFGFRYIPSDDGTTCIKGSRSNGGGSENSGSSDTIPVVPIGGPITTPITPGFVPGEIVDPGNEDCNADTDCSMYNCCSGMAENVTREQIDENNANRAEAQTASEAQEQAYYEYMAAKEQLAKCGNDQQKCQEAREAMDRAEKAFIEATQRVMGAVERYNASNLVVFPELGKAGTGYLLCANGLLAQTCKDGSQGTPYLKGIPGADEKMITPKGKGFLATIFAWPNVILTIFGLCIPILLVIQSMQKDQKKLKRRS